MTRPRARSVALAVAAVATAAMLSRSLVAIALMNRGDTVLRAGDPSRALSYYDRALWFDRTSSDVAGRLALATLLTGERAQLARSLQTLRAASRGSGVAELAEDEGLLAFRLGRYPEAAAAFARAASTGGDGRYFAFAAFSARREGKPKAFLYWWRKALRVDPALRRSRTARYVR